MKKKVLFFSPGFPSQFIIASGSGKETGMRI